MNAMDDRRESIGDLVRQLANQSATLVRSEVALAKREVGEKAAAVSVDVAIVAAGAAVGLVASLALTASLVIALIPYTGAWQAALTVGLVLLIGAVVLALFGYRRLTRETLKPEQTIDSIEENKQWLRKLT
jgi:uncharacterized membrane protein YqjE